VDPKQAELVGLVRRLVDALEASKIPYALGGAIALAAWSEPRATKDVDLTLFVEDSVPDSALDALERAGLDMARDRARSEAKRRGMFVLRAASGYRVDVFVASIPFYRVAEQRRRRVKLADRETYVLDAESLAVFKMLFFRGKDLVDIAKLIELEQLDVEFVRAALVDIVGEDDERIARLDAMAAGQLRI
jgi:hypothetical protein